MKRYLLFIFIVNTLSGCGIGDRVASWRPILVENNRVCYSVDNADVLSRFVITSIQGDDYRTFTTNAGTSLHYPETCLALALPRGYTYATSYTLNGENYRYNFFIDNNGHASSILSGDK